MGNVQVEGQIRQQLTKNVEQTEGIRSSRNADNDCVARHYEAVTLNGFTHTGH
jgi:hypothetical protein